MLKKIILINDIYVCVCFSPCHFLRHILYIDWLCEIKKEKEEEEEEII